jgi:hypothetical protein
MVNQALIRAALEAEELRPDEAEANVLGALRSEDSPRRDAASYFIIKNSVRSKRRRYPEFLRRRRDQRQRHRGEGRIYF